MEFKCDVCAVLVHSQTHWDDHLKGKAHQQNTELRAKADHLLPNFTSTFLPDLPNAQVFKPKPTNAEHFTSPNAEFISPSQPKKSCLAVLKKLYSSFQQQSRPNSPSSTVSRLILPRSRVASIRRESDCSSEKKFSETEAAHEKMVKSAQQVAMGFEDFCLDDKSFEERKRAKSLTEPISIFTNAFLPQSSSPSPGRGCVDGQKQCYSPSAQQVVRGNLAYSPSPSPTPASSPSIHRMRSMSPIAVRQIAKRRYTCSSNGNNGNGNVSGLESDGEGSASSFSNSAPAFKRQCTTPKSSSNSSPLVRDATGNLLPQQSPLLSSSSSMADFFSASNPSYSVVSNLGVRFGSSHSNKFLVDPNLSHFPSVSAFHGQEEEHIGEEEDEPRDNQLLPSFCSSSMFNDANSSTTFSSRANTPESLQYGVENDNSSAASLFPPRPPHSACSSDGTSSNCSTSHLLTNTDLCSKPIGFGLLPLSDPSQADQSTSAAKRDDEGIKVGDNTTGKTA